MPFSLHIIGTRADNTVHESDATFPPPPNEIVFTTDTSPDESQTRMIINVRFLMVTMLIFNVMIVNSFPITNSSNCPKSALGSNSIGIFKNPNCFLEDNKV
ncbi:hypothetical protein RCL_jg11088.t1 [Rhizophagus clarus]|uniref:Transmembrane protein n=1 Tax=Rhizophagus clarus TaxID=94130 RepID=A0A8H3R6A7_9GLOM|nr:hypothetical protein RCL_jg11088.t1 [Rhizophagus clarus]